MSDTCMCCGEELLANGKCDDCDYCDLCHSPVRNTGDEYCEGCIAGYGVHADDDWDELDEAAADAERAANEGGHEG